MAMYVRGDLETFDRYQFDWVIVPSRSKFATELAKYRSLSTGLLGTELWEIAYRDHFALYLVRKKSRTGA